MRAKEENVFETVISRSRVSEEEIHSALFIPYISMWFGRLDSPREFVLFSARFVLQEKTEKKRRDLLNMVISRFTCRRMML
jgi:hypothetical protein